MTAWLRLGDDACPAGRRDDGAGIQFSVQGSGLNGIFLFTTVGAGLLF
jgi:hypothetical protein